MTPRIEQRRATRVIAPLNSYALITDDTDNVLPCGTYMSLKNGERCTILQANKYALVTKLNEHKEFSQLTQTQ
jgi:hypothetical protein